jgi:hypothetical protein
MDGANGRNVHGTLLITVCRMNTVWCILGVVETAPFRSLSSAKYFYHFFTLFFSYDVAVATTSKSALSERRKHSIKGFELIVV